MADGVLEVGDVGDEVGAQVVAVDVAPEGGVLGALELRVKGAQLGQRLVQLAGRGRGRVDEMQG